MDTINGQPYDDDEDVTYFGDNVDRQLDPGMTRFSFVKETDNAWTSRLIAEAQNPGFRAVRGRPVRDGWRIELWKEKQ